MASELSRFIEDELRKQGIEDDEEQRLLSNLRVKPLSVQAGPASSGSRWGTKQKVLLGVGLAVLFGALVALVINYRGHPPTTMQFRGGMADPEAGIETLPVVDRSRQAKEEARKKAEAQAVAQREAEEAARKAAEEARRKADEEAAKKKAEEEEAAKKKAEEEEAAKKKAEEEEAAKTKAEEEEAAKKKAEEEEAAKKKAEEEEAAKKKAEEEAAAADKKEEGEPKQKEGEEPKQEGGVPAQPAPEAADKPDAKTEEGGEEQEYEDEDMEP